jgi:purine-binding chemotaxis protein CheW
MSNGLDGLIKKQQEQQQSLKDSENAVDDVIQLVGFVIGEEEYAIPILGIQEIIKPIEFTRVPGVPSYVLGVFNLRGSVIPLIDLRRKFGLQSTKQDEKTRYIVMKNEHNEAGFVIDELTEAVRLKNSRISPPPETFQNQGKMIYGIGKKDDGILTILNVDELLKRDF